MTAIEKMPSAGVQQRMDRKFAKIVTLAGWGVAAVALAGLLGAFPGLRLLGSIRAEYVPMAPTTVASFLVLAATLLSRAAKPLTGFRLTAAAATVLLVVVYCLLEFAELFVGRDLNFDDALWPVTDRIGDIPVGVMSPATAFTFCLAGLGCLLLMRAGRSSAVSRRLGNWASGLGAATAVVGTTVLLAYLYGTPLMYGGGAVPMAATTALAFLLLGVALAASTGPECLPGSLLTGDSTSALLSRSFLPLMLSAVVAESLISRLLSTYAPVNQALLTAFLVTVLGVVTASVVNRVANSTGGNIDEVSGDLRRALKELQESEEHYRSILRTAMDGVWLADAAGRLLKVNQAYCRMSGYSESELLSMSVSDLEASESAAETAAHIQRIVALGEDRFESRHRRKDGSIYYVEVSAQHRPSKEGQILAFFHDISARKFKEIAQRAEGELLQLAGVDSNLSERLSSLTASLQSLSGCEAVGVRLRLGDEYPYYQTRGFPAVFLQSADRLCAGGPDGESRPDRDGRPLPDCLCGQILCGSFDPDKPFFTPLGTFWSNNMSSLVAAGAEADWPERRSHRCSCDGYESLALVPLRAGEQIIGLLQCNDRRPDRFSPDLIRLLEEIADKLALTLVRWQAEEALRQSEEIYRSLFENTLNGIAYCRMLFVDDVPKDFVCLAVNRSFQTLTGLQDAAGRRIGELIPGIGESDPRFFEILGRVARNGQPERFEILVEALQMWFSISAYSTKAEHFVMAFNVVTERKKAEQELRESRKQYYDLVEGSPDLFTRVDREGRILFVNHAALEIFGLAPQECIGRQAFDFIHQEDRDATLDSFQRWLTGDEEIFTHENRQVAIDGREHYMAWSIRPERGAGGELLGFASTAKDITARKIAEMERLKLESQLQQAQKLESVGSLAGGVAHDFNNMLSVILGHASMVLMQLEPNHPLHSHLEEISKAAERSADLTRQLLAFARKQTIAPKVLNLNQTLASMLKMLERLIGEEISLNWQPGANLWPVSMDPSQIDQILANLCVNSRDAITGVGAITIETDNRSIDEGYCGQRADLLPGQYVRLAVSDNGCGMDSETLAHIYEPFFTTKEMGKGTGLGLSTVFGIVKQNHGHIDVYSEPGMGTTFSIYLPRHTGGGNVPPEGAAQASSVGSETILLVEDESAILKMVAMILGRQGYEVVQANSPAEALRVGRERAGEIHLLVTDVVMPEMNGKELADILRALHPRLKCLFMSGYTADAIARHGVLDDGVNFIQKPFSLPGLASKVREVLDEG